MRTRVPGSQILDQSVDTVDLVDEAVTDAKLSPTGVAAGTFTKVTVNTKGRVTAGLSPTTLSGLGLNVPLDDLSDVVLGTPTLGDLLQFNGTQWVNAPVTAADLSLVLYSENPQSAVDATASGFNSIALGSGATAGSSNSIAIGDQSLTRIVGAINQANGRFASQGDAQVGRYLLRSHTINATPTELFLNGTAGGERLTITDDTTWTFTVTIVGHQQDGNGHAGFRVKGVFYKVGAVNTFILGATTKEVIATQAGWDVSVTADSTNSALKITATGEAGKIIRWMAIVETVEVTN